MWDRAYDGAAKYGGFCGKAEKGYYSADFFGETLFVIASDKVKKVIKGYAFSLVS